MDFDKTMMYIQFDNRLKIRLHLLGYRRYHQYPLNMYNYLLTMHLLLLVETLVLHNYMNHIQIDILVMVWLRYTFLRYLIGIHNLKGYNCMKRIVGYSHFLHSSPKDQDYLVNQHNHYYHIPK